MGKHQKTWAKILGGLSDSNIKFDDLKHLLLYLGFEERIKGSHHILTHREVEEILNIQSRLGEAKPYQVKQVRNIILKYKLKL